MTLSVETRHQLRFTLLTWPQVVSWVRVRSGSKTLLHDLLLKLANHGLNCNYIKQKSLIREKSQMRNFKSRAGVCCLFIVHSGISGST